MEWPALATAPDADPAVVAEPLVAYGARIAGDKVRTRIVIDFEKEPEFKVHYIASPPRIIVDLPATAFNFDASELEARGLFSDIRYGAIDADSARLVLTAEHPARLVMSEVQEDVEGKGYRLVLDAETAPDHVFNDLVRMGWNETATASKPGRAGRVPPVAPANRGDFVVAIDAGHGGIDAGASGAVTKTPEKEITLAFAKEFADELNRQPGFHAFLTRTGDEFLSLSERVAIARRNEANLFISFHADTLRQSYIRGATVYTISDNASDKMAASLAERENLSDEVAGVAQSVEPDQVTDILLDLTRRETQAFSVSLADSVVKSFEGEVGLINNPHRYAGFRVLQAHDVPSILLELGFLSNKEDEKLLLDPKWRAKVCGLLTEAVKKYHLPIIANGG